MTRVRPVFGLAVTGAALVAASMHAAAAAPPRPFVGAQTAQRSGRLPVDIPGQRPTARAGRRLRHGQVVIARAVTVGAGQNVTLTLLCPKRTVQRGLGIGPGATVVFTVADLGHYVGSRRVKVRAAARAPSGGPASGYVYGLCS